MARQTRQARRAQERRQQAVRRQHPQGIKLGWPALAGAVIVVAFAAFLLFKATQNNGAATATITGEGPTVNGIGCPAAGMTPGYHIHAQLNVLRNGKPLTIAPDAGHYYNYDCLYWMHAHDALGIIHLESPQKIVPTLRTWFKILANTETAGAPNITPGPGQARKAYVNGVLWHGDPLNIPIKQHETIYIEIGSPFVKPVPFNFAAQGL